MCLACDLSRQLCSQLFSWIRNLLGCADVNNQFWQSHQKPKSLQITCKLTSRSADPQSSQWSFDTDIRCALCGRYTRQLHLLQSSLHLGALIGSRTSVPSHSGHEHTPCWIIECRHVGCGHIEQGIPRLPLPVPFPPSFPDPTPPNITSAPSNGGWL